MHPTTPRLARMVYHPTFLTMISALSTLRHFLIPKIKVRFSTSSSPKWFTPNIRHDLNCIHTLRRINKEYPTQSNTLTKAESCLRSKIASAKSNYGSYLVHSFAHSNTNTIFAVETSTANRRPNGVLVICLKGCWSTI